MVARKRSPFIKVVIIGMIIAYLVVIAQDANANPNRTNILIVMNDDLGFGDVGYNGGRSRTPNLNNMAKSPSVIHLNSMHSEPVCSPSRALLHSGQYPDRNCISGTKVFDTMRPPYWMSTSANDTKLAGYRTAFFGKWHLGPLEHNMVQMLGYDTWTASYGNLFPYDSRCFCNEVACQRLAFDQCSAPGCYRLIKVCSASYTRTCSLGHMNRLAYLITPPNEDTRACTFLSLVNETVVTSDLPRFTVTSAYLAKKFDQFLEDVKPDENFYAVIALHEPHIPFVGDPAGKANSSRFHGLAYDSRTNDYITCVENADRAVGMIRSSLAKFNRTENTMLVFTSDNGAEKPSRGGGGSNGGLRDWKQSVFEGGIRVPGLIDWPSMIKSNIKINEVTSLADIRATIRDILRSENPDLVLPGVSLDGESLLPMIRSPSSWKRSRDLLICSVRQKQSQKICQWYAFIRGNLKVVLQREYELANRIQLMFNLTANMYERYSIAPAMPEVYLDMVSRARLLVGNIMISNRRQGCY